MVCALIQIDILKTRKISVNCRKLGYRLCAAQHFKSEYTRCQNLTSFPSYGHHIGLCQLKKCHEAPIVHFPTEENPNRISDSSLFTAKNKNNSGKFTARITINSKSKSNSNLSSSMSVQSNLY